MKRTRHLVMSWNLVATSYAAFLPSILVAMAGLGVSASCWAGGGVGEGGTVGTIVPSRVAYIDGKEVPTPNIRMGDAETISRILDEGVHRNQVMDHLKHLSKEIGPRLTGSSHVLKANNWTKSMYTLWGLDNPRLETWGDIGVGFDRGPSTGKLLLRKEKKAEDGTITTEFETLRDFQLSTLAWTVGTNGAVRGKIIKEPRTDEDYAAVKDHAKGSWVLLDPPAAQGQRGVRSGVSTFFERRKAARAKLAEGGKVEDLAITERLAQDGVAGFITTIRDNPRERIWTGAVAGWRDLTVETLPPDVHVVVRGSDYDAINSRLYDGDTVEIEMNLQHTFTPGPVPVYNTIAEIRGTELPDEVVIVSAHMDSWDGPGSEGCTDNGTGTAVTLEAARILKVVNAKPKRTIRFVHWTGEEQGLLGSHGYVEKHKNDLSKISAVFVDDGGTNYQGGLACIPSMVPMLAAATAPVNGMFFDSADQKPLIVNIRASEKMPKGGSSDHASFNAVGVPGFFWDEVGRADYGHGWHTQFDRYELAIPEYLMQSSTCVAVTAYNLACAETLLPREVKEVEEKKTTN